MIQQLFKQIVTQTPCPKALSGRVVRPGTETVGETEPGEGNGFLRRERREPDMVEREGEMRVENKQM